MADAEVFVANALVSIAGIGVFSLLYYFAHKEKNRLLENIWLSGIILIMTYLFAVQRVAFNAIGLYDLRDLSFTILEILMWVFLGIFLLSIVSLVQTMGKIIMRTLTGDKDYEHEGE